MNKDDWPDHNSIQFNIGYFIQENPATSLSILLILIVIIIIYIYKHPKGAKIIMTSSKRNNKIYKKH